MERKWIAIVFIKQIIAWGFPPSLPRSEASEIHWLSYQHGKQCFEAMFLTKLQYSHLLQSLKFIISLEGKFCCDKSFIIYKNVQSAKFYTKADLKQFFALCFVGWNYFLKLLAQRFQHNLLLINFRLVFMLGYNFYFFSKKPDFN